MATEALLADLPHGWEAKLDTSSGNYYYIDHLKGKSTWVRPEPPKQAYLAPPPRPPPPPPPPTDLPPGWEPKTIEDTGEVYYIDHVNRVATWTRPTQMAVLEGTSFDVNDFIPESPEAATVASTDTSGVSTSDPSFVVKSTATITSKASSSASSSQGIINNPDVIKPKEPRIPTRPPIFSVRDSFDEDDDVSKVTSSDGGTTKSHPSPRSSHYGATAKKGSTGPRNIAAATASTMSSHESSSTIPTVVDPNDHMHFKGGMIGGDDASTIHSNHGSNSQSSNTTKSLLTMAKPKSPYPFSEPERVAKDLESWMMSEAPKQRELAPRGMYAVRKFFSKRSMDKKTAVENVHVSNVSMNGYILNQKQLRWWAVQFKVRFRSDTHYWYDKQGGFVGKLGGPLKWTVDATLPLHGEMHPRASLGNTMIYINGREILEAEKKRWGYLKMQLVPHTHYIVDATGWVRRVGDDQPLYNWRHKEMARKKGAAKGMTVTRKTLGINVEDILLAAQNENKKFGSLQELMKSMNISDEEYGCLDEEDFQDNQWAFSSDQDDLDIDGSYMMMGGAGTHPSGQGLVDQTYFHEEDDFDPTECEC